MRNFSIFLYTLVLSFVTVHSIAQEASSPIVAGNISNMVVLSDTADPYYSLAHEISTREHAPLVHSLDSALASDPVYVIWVASPGFLSDVAFVKTGIQLSKRPQAISLGIITGSTMQTATDLYYRRERVRGARCGFINAIYPVMLKGSEIVELDGNHTRPYELSKSSFTRVLRQMDYLTFSGHGNPQSLCLYEHEAKIYSEEIPSMPPLVIATASCNTFPNRGEKCISLSFIAQGAAAYAGLSFSTSGHILGSRRGLPFRYTWPDFPIGHIVQIQNKGLMRATAAFQSYFLLGDPRICLQSRPPYQIISDQSGKDVRIIKVSNLPQDFVPLRIPQGARYHYLKVPGIGAITENTLNYNARLDMADIAGDKYILIDQPGGSLTIELRETPPVMSRVLHPWLDSLDLAQLSFFDDSAMLIISLIIAAITLGLTAFRLHRRPHAKDLITPSLAVALVLASLSACYAFCRIDFVTASPKNVMVHPSALLTQFVLVFCGLILFKTSTTPLCKALSISIPIMHLLMAAIFAWAMMFVYNYMVASKIGAGIFNYHLPCLALLAAATEYLFFGIIFGLAFKNKKMQSI